MRGIFEAKERPLTDPALVHVTSADSAFELLDLSDAQRRLMAALVEHHWPGPLTLIAKASDAVPPIVTAGTGSVGVRCPSHPIARRLIDAAGVPVAAPSANRFGHVSPTEAEHVAGDLGSKDVMILDGGACEFGIESTVVRLERSEEGELVFLRRGAVTESAVLASLAAAGLGHVRLVHAQKKAHVADGAQVAPGQLITHYAPDVPAYMHVAQANEADRDGRTDAKDTVCIDFGGVLRASAPTFLAYRDLSETGRGQEAAAGVYAALRWGELIADAKAILLPNLDSVAAAQPEQTDTLLAVHDRLFRASSGRTATFSADFIDMFNHS